MQTVYAPDGTELSDSQKALGQCAVDLLQALGPAFGLSHLTVKQAGMQAVASLHGGLICLRDGPINLGFLFRALQEEPVVAPKSLPDVPPFTDRADAAMWQVMRRIMRVVAPRQLIFAAGEVRLAIAAADGAFDVLSGASSLDTGLAALRAAVKAGHPLSYTLGEPPEVVAVRSQLADLLRAGAAQDVTPDTPGLWRAVAGGWPGNIPPDATYTTLSAIMLAAAAAQRAGTPLELSGYDAVRQPFLRGASRTGGGLWVQIRPEKNSTSGT